MDYRQIGRTGLRIGSIALGTQTFGWNTDEETAKKIMSLYQERGGNYFDSADSYNAGESERILGLWMKESGTRDSCVVGTKTFFPTGKGPNDSGLSRKHIFQSVDESLRRLNTDYIDLYQLHCFDALTPLDETLRALDDLVSAGKIRYVGLSNFAPSKIMKTVMTSRYEGWISVAALQLEYSLLVRSAEWELLPLCRDEGIGTLAWSPLAGGWLTGKYRRDADIPSESRAGRGDRWDDGEDQRGTERAYDIIDVLLTISDEVGKPASQVSLNWMIQQKIVTAPLIGARTIGQLEQNLGALDWELEENQLERLNAVSAPSLPSPYSFIQRYTRK